MATPPNTDYHDQVVPRKDNEKGPDETPDLIADGSGMAAQYANSDELKKANQGAAIPESTQENMGDGAGIRGDYGNSDQTNGLEGDQADQDLPATKAEEEDK